MLHCLNLKDKMTENNALYTILCNMPCSLSQSLEFSLKIKRVLMYHKKDGLYTGNKYKE